MVFILKLLRQNIRWAAEFRIFSNRLLIISIGSDTACFVFTALLIAGLVHNLLNHLLSDCVWFLLSQSCVCGLLRI